MAPRGIVAASVASIFALRLAEEGRQSAEELVPLTFLVIVGTIVVYGLSGSYVAKRLGLQQPEPQGALLVGAHAWAREIAQALKAEGFTVALVDSNRRNVTEAQLAGLRGVYANVLAEGVIEDIDLSGIGRLFALTPNDEANSLASQRFSEVFGRAQVFQLSPSQNEKLTTRQRTEGEMPRYLRGRPLFGEQVTYRDLDARFEEGASVKVTNISDTFSFESFRERYGEEALPLFVVTQAKTLSVFTGGSAPTPRPGQKLISIVFDTDEPIEQAGESLAEGAAARGG
jgi:hypothetical protein